MVVNLVASVDPTIVHFAHSVDHECGVGDCEVTRR
jgi:hypothetical protein